MKFPAGRRVRLTALAAAVAALVTTGIAYATIPDSNGVIHGCFAKSGGSLRVIDNSTSSCTSKETALNWNVQGVQGPPGPPGPKGDTGPIGPSDAFIGSHNGFELVASDNSQHEVLSIGLPAGAYAVTAKVNVQDLDGLGRMDCLLNIGGNPIDEGAVVVDGATNSEATIALTSVGGLDSTGTSTVSCQTATTSMYVWGIKIVAVKVGAFHQA